MFLTSQDSWTACIKIRKKWPRGLNWFQSTYVYIYNQVLLSIRILVKEKFALAELVMWNSAYTLVKKPDTGLAVLELYLNGPSTGISTCKILPKS